MRALARSDGKINIVVVGMLLVIAAIVYGIMFYTPVWSRNRKVMNAMREAAYQAWRNDDAKIRDMIRDKTDTVWVVQDGNRQEPLIDDQTILIDRQGAKITIGISYSVLAQYPYTDKYQEITFDNEVKGTLENPRVAKPDADKNGFWSFLGLE